jgi:hypothetical protein
VYERERKRERERERVEFNPQSPLKCIKMTINKATFLGDFMCSEMNSTNTETINIASNAAKLPLDVLV